MNTLGDMLGWKNDDMTIFLLTANSEATGDNGEWGGFVTGVKDYIFEQNKALLAHICELLSSKDNQST